MFYNEETGNRPWSIDRTSPSFRKILQGYAQPAVKWSTEGFPDTQLAVEEAVPETSIKSLRDDVAYKKYGPELTEQYPMISGADAGSVMPFSALYQGDERGRAQKEFYANQKKVADKLFQQQLIDMANEAAGFSKLRK